ncbi:MAG: hypothetical protein O7E52_27820 [Candidatus Poribacteria bacterium]|nr:hypothetical protein [Candidatus Poribacteria bacterium]
MKNRDIQTGWGTKFSLLLTLLTASALLWSNPAAESAKMYWTNARGIDRAERDGGSLETLLSVTLSGPEHIAVDATEGKIYWTDALTRKIQRANLDGTNIEDLVTGLVTPRFIALDFATTAASAQEPIITIVEAGIQTGVLYNVKTGDHITIRGKNFEPFRPLHVNLGKIEDVEIISGMMTNENGDFTTVVLMPPMDDGRKEQFTITV